MNATRPDYVSESDKEIETALDVARRIDLDGFSDEFLGDVDGFGYFAMVRGPLEDSTLAQLFKDCPNLEVQHAFTVAWSEGWIISSNSQGFWDLETYDTREALETAWTELSESYALWYGPEESDYVVYFQHSELIKVSEVRTRDIGLIDAPTLETFSGESAETDARAWISQKMERDGFWPNIWETSDGEYFGRVETDESGNHTVRYPN
jgi:hypothetical protein